MGHGRGDGVEFEKDVLAAEDEKVGILRQDPVDDIYTLEIGELGICFIRCDDIRNILSFERLCLI